MESPRRVPWIRWAGAIALALLIVALAWPQGEVGVPAPQQDVVDVDDGQADPVVTPELLREQDGAAAALDAPTDDELQPDVDLSHPFPFALDVRVKDRFALPVDDAMVFVAPPSCGFTLWPERTDARGELRVEWSGRGRAMDLQVAVIAWGVLQPIRNVRCEADRTAQVAFAVRGSRQSEEVVASHRALAQKPVHERAVGNWEMQRQLRRQRAAGRLQREDELDILCGRTQLLFQQVFVCADCHQPGRVQPYSMLARAGTWNVSLHPSSGFHDLRERKLDPKAEQSRREAADASQPDEDEPPARARRARGKVKGVVTDADGNAVSGVPVALLGEGGVVRKQTTTGADGDYVLDALPTGTVDLRAGGGSAGVATAAVMTAPRHATQCNFRLERSSAVRGVVVDADDRRLTQWRVELTRSEGDWASWATTDRDGAFSFSGVPGAAQCLLWPRDQEAALPIVYGDSALVGATPVRLALRHDNPTRARLRVRPVLPEEFDHMNVDARLVQVDTGFVAQVRPFPFERALELTLLPPGPYRLQIGAPGLGWVHYDAIWLDGRGLHDCGSVLLPRPGRVRVRAVEGYASPLDGTHAFYRRTEAVDVRVAAAKVDGFPDVRRLPPDDYVLVWREAEGDVRAQAVRVASGLLSELVVGPR